MASVIIPDSVKTIGDGAFSGVKNIVYTGDATGRPWNADKITYYYTEPDENGFIYIDAEKTKLGAYVGENGEVTIPRRYGRNPVLPAWRDDHCRDR